jgi:molybdopterin converting factor small subunit
VRGAVDALVEAYPAIGPELLNGDGQLHPHVHVFVEGRDVHYLAGGLDAPLPAEAKLDVFPAVGGG